MWSTGQNYKPLKKEDEIKITLVNNKKMTRYSIEGKVRVFVKGYGFLLLAENMRQKIKVKTVNS